MTKNNVLKKLGPTSVRLPAIAGRPAIPARYYYVEELAGYEWVREYQFTIYTPDPFLMTPTLVVVDGVAHIIEPPPWGAEGRYVMVRKPVYRKVRKRTEAIPAIESQPAQTITFNGRWDGHANSVHITGVGGGAKFQVDEPIGGAVVGLSSRSAPNGGIGYGHIEHGLVFLNGDVRAMDGAILGSFTDADVFRIDAGLTEVTFSKDDEVIHTEPLMVNRAAPLYLAATLHTPTDQIFNPVLLVPSVMDAGANFRFTAFGADTDVAMGLAVFKFSAEGGHVPHGIINLRFQAGGSDYNYAGMNANLLRFGAEGLGGAFVAESREYTDISMLTMSAYGELLAGGLSVEGSGAGFRFQSWGTDGEGGHGLATIGLFRAAGREGSHILELPFGHYAVVQFGLRDTHKIAIDLGPRVGLGVAFDARDSHQLDFRDGVQIGVAYELRITERLEFPIALGFEVPMEALGKKSQTWLSTPGEQWATTTYSNYPFNSYAQIGDAVFGASDLGLFVLDGSTDAGDEICAALDLGVVDFRDKGRKAIPNAYLSMSGDAPLLLTINAEGRSFSYPTRGYSPHMQEQRIDLGRGLCMTYAGLQITNQGGADFEVDSLEFLIASSNNRRI